MPNANLTHHARKLRADQTDVERLLWSRLRNRQLGGCKWRRQVPRGAYIADFLCAETGLVVELDGGQHVEQAAYDARRTAYLEEAGLRVLRFWNPEVIDNLEGVCETILAACGSDRPLTPPSPPRGEG